MKRRLAINEEIVLDDGIAPAADKGSLGDLVEHIAVAVHRREQVIQIHSHAALALEPVHMVNVVVADDVAALVPILVHAWLGIDGPRVVGMFDDVVQFVVLDHVLLSEEADRDMRRVVDQVVRRPAADTDHLDAWPIHRVPAAVVVNQVVVRIMLAVRECRFIAAFQRDAAIAHPVQVAAHDTMVRAAGNVHREATRVTDRAGRDEVIAAAADRDRGALAAFQHEPAQHDMRRLCHGYQAGT